jgi:hypothetical protein
VISADLRADGGISARSSSSRHEAKENVFMETREHYTT